MTSSTISTKWKCLLLLAMMAVFSSQALADRFRTEESRRQISADEQAEREELARWTESLNSDVRRRVLEHANVKGGISSHPIMTRQVLGVVYPPIKDLPAAVFHEQLASHGGRTNGEALWEVFNIQLLSPNHRLSLPDTTKLVVDFDKYQKSMTVEIPMTLRDGSYYIDDVTSASSDLIDVFGELGSSPLMQLSRLEGFEFNSDTVEDMLPLGVPITYNIRFGSVRVDTGFQWAGRPASIPKALNGGREFLK